MSQVPLNIVWRRQVLETVLESSFIRFVLLSKINRPQRWIAIEESDDFPMMDDLLVVSFGDPVSYFEALKGQGYKNIGFFQVGDEQGEKGCTSYALADYVLRNYHFPGSLAEKPGLISWVSEPGGGTTDYAVEIYHKAITQGKYTSFLSEKSALPMMYMDDAIKATVQIMQAPEEQIKIRSSYNLSAMSFTPAQIAEEIKKH